MKRRSLRTAAVRLASLSLVVLVASCAPVSPAAESSDPVPASSPSFEASVPSQTLDDAWEVVRTPTPTPSRTKTGAPTRESSLRAKLDRLPIRAESRAGSYARSAFRHWTDADRDCEDTRAEVLRAESKRSVTQTDRCRVVSGKWFSLYDGVTITDAARLDVDHMVPLAEAWRSGAWKWTSNRRKAFANDLLHGATLRAVTLSTNRSKGDRDPAQWLPPRRASWCRYASDWVSVKTTWKLSLNAAERDALRVMVATC